MDNFSTPGNTQSLTDTPNSGCLNLNKGGMLGSSDPMDPMDPMDPNPFTASDE